MYLSWIFGSYLSIALIRIYLIKNNFYEIFSLKAKHTTNNFIYLPMGLHGFATLLRWVVTSIYSFLFTLFTVLRVTTRQRF